MIIVIHVNRIYDWEPLPEGTEAPSAKEQQKKLVKPAMGGGWLMRVKRDVKTHTQVVIPENQLINMVVGEAVREKVALTRKQAAALWLSRHVMPEHAHPNWFESIEVDDDGPSEELFRAALAPQLEAGNIEEESVDGLVKSYLEPSSKDDHVSHMTRHFGLDKRQEKAQ